MTPRYLKASIGWSLVFITLCIVTTGWSKWTLITSLRQQYALSYQSLTPSKIYSGGMDDGVVSAITDKITHALSGLRTDSILPVVNQCRVSDIRATERMSETAQWLNRLMLRLVLDDPYHHLTYTGTVQCHINWPVIISSQGLLTVVLILLLNLLPKPLCRETAILLTHLTERGGSPNLRGQLLRCTAEQRNIIRSICEHPALGSMAPDKLVEQVLHYQLSHLTRDEIDWLTLAFAQFNSEKKAFRIAFGTPEALHFNLSQRLIKAKGIEIKLAPTPYYYFLWYAQKRINSQDGWVLNPITTKADQALAAELIELMQVHGGHGKAINDLSRNGLTAKKLDQNRNKIKEEIAAVLGEELARPFLFEARREATSQRYSYRIQLSAEKIAIS